MHDEQVKHIVTINVLPAALILRFWTPALTWEPARCSCPAGLEHARPDLPALPGQPVALGAAWPGGPLPACCQRVLEC